MDFIISSKNRKLVQFNNDYIYLYEFGNDYYIALKKILQIINKGQCLAEILNSSVFKLATKNALDIINKEMVIIIKTNFLNLIKLKFGIDINFNTLQSFSINDEEKVISKITECKVIFNQVERSESNNFVRKLCKDNRLNYQKIWSNIYNEVERRKGCNLNLKLQNLKTKYISEGKTKTKRINKLDVIFSDPQLVKIYQSVINDMGSGKITC